MKPSLLFTVLLLIGSLTACPSITTPPSEPPVAPVVTITTPIAGQNFTTPSATIAGIVIGKVTSLSYTDNANTPRYPLTATGNFSFSVGLNPGANTIHVYAQNGSSTEASSAITINYPVPPATTKYTLSTSKTGQGSIISNPAGITCGITCAFDFAKDASVTLTATPDLGSSFSNWGGACTGTINTCTITMNQAQNVTATFTTNPAPVDTILPSILILSPTNSNTDNSSISVSGTASDNVGMTQIQYTINGGSKLDAPGTISWNFNAALNVGLNTIVIYARDAAGNEKSATLSIMRNGGMFSLAPASSNIVIAQNADALYYLYLTKTAPFTTNANALSSITATGSIVGSGANQVRVFYRPDLSSATQAAIVIQAGSSVPLGAQSLVLNAVGGGVNAAPLTLNFTTVVCSSGC